MRSILALLLAVPISFIQAQTMGSDTLYTQPVGADTLYLESGGVLYGDVTNYPPDDVVDFQTANGTFFRVPVESVNVIYPAPYKRNAPAPYVPSPAAATAVSVFIPGLGMIISGHERGYAYLGVAALAVGIMLGAPDLGGKLAGYSFLLASWTVSIIDTPAAVAGVRNDLRRVYPYRFRSMDRQQLPQGQPLTPQSTSLSFSIPLQ